MDRTYNKDIPFLGERIEHRTREAGSGPEPKPKCGSSRGRRPRYLPGLAISQAPAYQRRHGQQRLQPSPVEPFTQLFARHVALHAPPVQGLRTEATDIRGGLRELHEAAVAQSQWDTAGVGPRISAPWRLVDVFVRFIAGRPEDKHHGLRFRNFYILYIKIITFYFSLLCVRSIKFKIKIINTIFNIFSN